MAECPWRWMLKWYTKWIICLYLFRDLDLLILICHSENQSISFRHWCLESCLSATTTDQITVAKRISFSYSTLQPSNLMLTWWQGQDPGSFHLVILPPYVPSGQLEGVRRKWGIFPITFKGDTLSCVCYVHSCHIDQDLLTYADIAAREAGKCGQLGGHLPR